VEYSAWELFLATMPCSRHELIATLSHTIKPTTLDFGDQAMPAQPGEQTGDVSTALTALLGLAG
jgi:hypothetical protein